MRRVLTQKPKLKRSAMEILANYIAQDYIGTHINDDGNVTINTTTTITTNGTVNRDTTNDTNRTTNDGNATDTNNTTNTPHHTGH